MVDGNTNANPRNAGWADAARAAVSKAARLGRFALCPLAVAFSFALYAMAFEPWGVAECAYVFAVPAILAARALFSKIPTPKAAGEVIARRKRNETEFPSIEISDSGAGEGSFSQSDGLRRKNRKVWLFSTFVFSYAAWISILIWLRHVYPPAGWVAVALLPLVISSLFIFPWFAILPKFLPDIADGAGRRISHYAGLAGGWVCLEWLRTHLFTGFPWLLLAHSQWQRPAAIQTAEIGGVWIVSFTVIFFNLAAAEYIWRLYAWQKYRVADNFSSRPPFSRFCPEIYAAILMIMSGLLIYVKNIPNPANEIKAFRAGMVQTDFAGILKWDDSLARQNVETIARLTNGLKSARADVVLWPEAATPPRWPIVGSPQMRGFVESLSKSANMPILAGNMAYFPDTRQAQNGAFFISPKSGLAENFYAKRKLVPFGEYTPAWASFIGKVVPVGNMARGENSKPLDAEIAGKNYKIGAMICYEDIFPQLGREAAANGADMLFVCTNDSWYGREAGAWQHAAHSALQAVATRKPLLRSSNNGLSAVFDQYGRMRPSFVLRDSDGNVWDASTPSPAPTLDLTDARGRPVDERTLRPKRPTPMVNDEGSIYFRGAGYSDAVFYKNFDGKTTLYVKYGDWFAALSAAFFCLSSAPILINSLRKKSTNH